MGKYDDMIHMDRPISKNHRPMSIENRAAQFAPFAALTGYDDAVEETARLTDKKIELTEEMKSEIDEVLMEIQRREGTDTLVTVTYFVEDLYKEGGEYITDTITVKRIDTATRQIILKDKRRLKIDNILHLDFV